MYTSPDVPRADQGIRVLSAPDEAAVMQELRRTGCAEAGVHIMAPKGETRLVRLEAVEATAALLLKQAMLSAGGDAAMHLQTISGGVATTPVVLIGTVAQLHTATTALRKSGFATLQATADAVVQVLAVYILPRSNLRCGPYTLALGSKTHLMGIINTTPDSFSGDGLDGSVEAAVRLAEAMVADGADLLDVGGESTRPGAEAVSEEEEIRRVAPVVAALARRVPVPISVDTTKSAVARAALDAGATLINDISGLRFDPDMAAVVASAGVPVVVMHIKGTPRTMQQHPEYDDLMTEVAAYLEESTQRAMAAGIPRNQVVLDPGFGFGKSVAHNLELLRRLRELTSTGQPILVGTSRKSTIGKVLGNLPPEERLEGTAATVAVSIMHGANIVRVHDVRAMARVARMTEAVMRG